MSIVMHRDEHRSIVIISSQGDTLGFQIRLLLSAVSITDYHGISD